MTPPHYLILAMVVVLSILKVIASLETKCGRLKYKCTCCKTEKWKYVNKVNTLGKANKQKEKICKILNETPLKRKFVFVTINNVKIKLQLDTRSNITIINEKTWRKLGRPSLLRNELP